MLPKQICLEKKKIKVLRIINRFNIGGPTYNATFLSRFLSDDFETLLVGGLPEEGEADSLHIVKEYGLEPVLLTEMKRTPGVASDRKAYQRLKQIIQEFQPDIVHTHAAKAGALGRRAAYACKVPVIVHTFHGHVFHSYFGRTKTQLFKLIERRLASRSEAIIAISDIQKKELTQQHRICAPDKITVVPLGFDLQRFQDNREENRRMTRNQWSIADDELAIAIVGRLAPIKNHAFFLEVIQEASKRTKRTLKVFIVGDGENRLEIEQRIAGMQLPDNCEIILTSWILDIAAFNAGMDIACLTSKNEGTPVSLIEAQASGVPVISTDVGGVRDSVSDGKTGLIVTPGALSEYTQQLLRLIEDDALRTELSSNGWEFVRERFHFTRLVKDVEDLYRKLLAEKK